MHDIEYMWTKHIENPISDSPQQLKLCLQFKWQKVTGYFHHIFAFAFPFCFTLRELCIGLVEVLPHTSRRICDWELLLSSHIFSKAPKFRG